MTRRYRWLVGGSLAVVALTVTVVVVLAWSPALRYRLTGRQWPFNVAVSRAVPRRATVARLECVVGLGKRGPVPGWMRRMMQRQPEAFPDGWRDGDTCVSYSFPGNSTWYFQVRDGRLVNYDPSVLAGQPQEHIATIIQSSR